MTTTLAREPRTLPPVRPEYERTVLDTGIIGAVQQQLSPAERIWGHSLVRRATILIVLAIIWQVYAIWLDNPLSFPTFSDTIDALRDGIASGVIPHRLLT